MSPEYDVRFCASNRISRPSLALPQTSALLCFIFVVSVSYGTSACGNDYCTSLGDHISFLSILSPHKQPSTALPRFMATYARGLTSQAVNLTHTTHWSECLMYYVANACSNRNLCNWRVYVTKAGPLSRHGRLQKFRTSYSSRGDWIIGLHEILDQDFMNAENLFNGKRLQFHLIATLDLAVSRHLSPGSSSP